MEPRFINLHPSTLRLLKRLKKAAESAGDQRFARRLHAILLNDQGYRSTEIASILNVSRSQSSKWLGDYAKGGYESLIEGHRSGRPSRLTDQQKLELSDIVESGPVAYGFLGGVWTAAMIASVIETEFGVSYHPAYVARLLHELDFSVQRPKRDLAKADPVEQARWKNRTYPALKKKRWKNKPR